MIRNNSNFISTTLGELVDFQGGNGFPSELQGKKNGDYPFFKVDDMNTQGNEKYLITAANYVNSDLVSSRSWRIVPADSIVFAKVGAAMTHNRRRILSQDSLIDNNMMAATTKGEVSVEWLYWWMLSLDLNRILNPGPIPSINQSQMAEIELYMPASNTERDNIASHLQSVESLASNQYILVQKLKMMRTGILNDLLTFGVDENGALRSPETHDFVDSRIGPIQEGWTKTTIGGLVSENIIEKPLDGNHGETHPKKSEFVETGVPFLMAADLKGGVVDCINCNFITRTQADSLRKGFAKDGDILISHKGTIGRVAVVETDLDYVMLTPQLTYYRVIDQSKILPRYLYTYFQSSEFVEQMTITAGSGSTRAYIGIMKQLELTFRYPSIEEQERIVERMDSISNRIKSEIALLNKYSTIKQGLMHDLLTGKVRVPTPAPDSLEVAA
jgi:restriction endonuclease S subunit